MFWLFETDQFEFQKSTSFKHFHFQFSHFPNDTINLPFL